MFKQTEAKPENTFQKKVLNDISSGETIEIDGKKFTKIQIQIVDSMSFRVSEYVDKLETELELLKKEVESLHTENANLIAQKEGQFHYISQLLLEKKSLQKVIEIKNNLIKRMSQSFREGFETFRKKGNQMLLDKKEQLDTNFKKLREGLMSRQHLLDEKSKNHNIKLIQDYSQKHKTLEAKYTKAIAALNKSQGSHTARIQYFMSAVEFGDAIFVNYANFIKVRNRFNPVYWTKVEVQIPKPSQSKKELMHEHRKQIDNIEIKYKKELKIFEQVKTHLEGKIHVLKEEISEHQQVENRLRKEIANNNEKALLSNKPKMDELYKINTELVETIKKLRKKIEKMESRFESFD